jgi:ATP phosphoribosyltransferase regulatory subunit HisZ
MGTCFRKKWMTYCGKPVKSRCRHRGAEGFESRTRSLFVDVLGRAKASAGEVRTQLVVARDQEYVNEGEFEAVHDRADKGSRRLHNLIQSLERSNTPDDVREVPQKYVTD